MAVFLETGRTQGGPCFTVRAEVERHVPAASDCGRGRNTQAGVVAALGARLHACFGVYYSVLRHGVL
jgi:bacterioferritin-associated ferredoxin